MKENITIIEAKPYKFALIPPNKVIVRDTNAIDEKAIKEYLLNGSHMFPLLQMIAFGNGSVVSTETLYFEIWGMDSNSELKSVQKTVHQIRKRITQLKGVIRAVNKKGYRLNGFQKVYSKSTLPIEFSCSDSDRIKQEYLDSFLSAKESDEYQTDFCHMQDHRSLKDYYVMPPLSNNNLLRKGSAVSGFSCLVIGPAGFGKTSLTKALLLCAIGELPGMFGIDRNYLPVYIKLDRFNHITEETSLLDLAFGAGNENFRSILSSAEEPLILIDGYDEVYDTTLLDKVLTAFCKKEKRAKIIVTSRYESPVFNTYEKVTLKKFRKEEIERYLDIAVENDSSLKNRCEEIRNNRVLMELAASPYTLYHEVYRCPGKPSAVLKHLLKETIERRWDIRKMEGIYAEEIKYALSSLAYNEIFVKSKEIPMICVTQKELDDFFYYASSDEERDERYTRETSPLVNFSRTMPIRSGVLSVSLSGNFGFVDEWMAKYLAAEYIVKEFSQTRVFSALSEMLDDSGKLTRTKLDGLALLMALLKRKGDQKQLIDYLLFRGFLSFDADEQKNICAALEMIKDRELGDNNVLGIGSPYLSLIERLKKMVSDV